MILAIDVGNTNIVMGGFEKEGEISFRARLSTNHSKTFEQYAVEIKNILELYDIYDEKISGAIISCVVPPLTNAMKNAVELVTGITPLVVGPGVKTGLNIMIDNPGQLGSDLVVGAVAALDSYEAPMVIFDLGTATTASVIDADRIFLGGTIHPGINVSLGALTSSTSQLPRISMEKPACVIGRNSIDSMTSGIVYGNASMIDGMVERIEEELGQHVSVIATGGLAELITPFCKCKVMLDPDLMLKGLFLIYRKNMKTVKNNTKTNADL
ncbi:MAG: type III pantothenate kinase [Eubacteriales bacterium]|nr:type III pantothenate kinase [Eubacteriales bacterium]